MGTGQVAVTQDQYADIVSQQLTELWTNYGDLAEIWFDGGFSVGGLQDQLLGVDVNVFNPILRFYVNW